LLHLCMIVWHEASVVSNAAWNNAKMLSLYKMNPIRLVADAASTALSRHLWYFSEHFIGLALFDSQVDLDVKKAMVVNLQLVKTPSAVWRVNAPTDTDFYSCRASQGRRKLRSFFHGTQKNGTMTSPTRG
jgi:hypothetical protein